MLNFYKILVFKLFVFILFSFFVVNINSAKSQTNVNLKDTLKVNKSIDMSKMKVFYLVLLKSGPNRTQDSTKAAEIQKGHMDNIIKLSNEGKIVMAGPIAKKDVSLRGIFVFNAKDEAEVEQLVKTDPAIIAGRLVYEIYPWFTEKGTCLPLE